MEGFQIVLFIPAADYYHRIVVAGEYVVDHQACDLSVAVLEWVDSDVAVVEDGSEFYWREFAVLLFFVVPVHEVCHQFRGFFRGCVFEAVSVTGDYAVRTGLVLPCVDDIAALLAFISSRSFICASPVTLPKSLPSLTERACISSEVNLKGRLFSRTLSVTAVFLTGMLTGRWYQRELLV